MQTVYEVETILDEAVIDNEPHYLIKWKNHSHQHDTWEPISNLHNISDYLQHWLRKRRENSSNRQKQQSKGSFKEIKPYLSRDHLKVPRKTTRQKYAEQILKKKKTWQKYIEKEQKCIEIDLEGPDDPKDCNQLLKTTKVRTDSLKEEQGSVLQKKKFKVIGSIDTSQIIKVVRIFSWKETKCAQVELNDGRRFNMKEDELKKYHPLMLVEYYQNQGVTF